MNIASQIDTAHSFPHKRVRSPFPEIPPLILELFLSRCECIFEPVELWVSQAV